MEPSNDDVTDDRGSVSSTSTNHRPGLKKIPPYWYPYRTNAKARWFEREILEVVSTEFRDRSVEYYRYALQAGVTTINGKIARPGTLVRNGDAIENVVHRHEPPVTSTPVEILHHDVKRDFIVINKPGSIPVHAAGRYFKNSLVEILKNDFGFPDVYTVNRLDRLTSGLMIIALSADRARALTAEFTSGTIQKEYVARVRGEFPREEITCDEPLLTVDRQMGLNIVHPEGKESKTIFKCMYYDKNTDTSVVHCKPVTGRSHQIRVHLQFLGHPIANDAVYGNSKIWGPRVGKGGIGITPSDERRAPQPPPELEDSTAEGQVRFQQRNGEADLFKNSGVNTAEPKGSPSPSPNTSRARSPGALRRMKKREARKNNPAFRTKEESAALAAKHTGEEPPPGMLPRETGRDIGLGSPVPLSKEAVDVITRLRNQKDEDEDWGRWRDVVFRAKGSINPLARQLAYAEQRRISSQARKKQKGKQDEKNTEGRDGHESEHYASRPGSTFEVQTPLPPSTVIPSGKSTSHEASRVSELGAAEPALADNSSRSSESQRVTEDGSGKAMSASAAIANGETSSDALYCPECYLPLHPDPKPEKLYIFLHALRYTSASLGSFETRLPEWASEGYTWE